jgi:DNA polymerase-4
MDAFFASVEARSDPRLSGRRFVVGGGPGKRGVVTTASYAAREHGVRSGMSVAEAIRLCPDLLFVPVDPSKYIHESLRVLDILDRFSRRVEAASIDEAYVEVDPVPAPVWQERALSLASGIQAVIRSERCLPCSVGAGVNRLQAKMMTARAKPAGVGAVPPGKFLEIMGGDPVGSIPGIGPVTQGVLGRLGILSIRDLSSSEPARLRRMFGDGAGPLIRTARGEDFRRIFPEGDRDPKSASHETTFATDTGDLVFLKATACWLADRVARRLRVAGLSARTVQIRYRIGRDRYTRQEKLSEPTGDPGWITRSAVRLIEEHCRGRSLRLLGVAGMGLVRAAQEPLLPGDRRRRELIRTSDRIRDRFGESVLLPAGVFPRGSRE